MSASAELARGGMATVYLARDHAHDRPVPVRRFDPFVAFMAGQKRQWECFRRTL